jgi:DnaJ-class molecular chaperone
MRGKGAPVIGSDQRGDAFITVKVKIPTSVGGKEKELVEKIAEEKKKGGFFSGFQ